LTARDLQDIRLAEHAEAYVKQEQQQAATNSGSLSHRNYDTSNSRNKAFN